MSGPNIDRKQKCSHCKDTHKKDTQFAETAMQASDSLACEVHPQSGATFASHENVGVSKKKGPQIDMKVCTAI